MGPTQDSPKPVPVVPGMGRILREGEGRKAVQTSVTDLGHAATYG